MPQRASVFCNFYIRVDREALVSERALDVGSVAFKAMRMFEIPANFNWRGLKDGFGNTITIIIIDIIIDIQRSKKKKNHQKVIIQVSNHSQSSLSVAKRPSSYSK
jgi:hypothetical protein